MGNFASTHFDVVLCGRHSLPGTQTPARHVWPVRSGSRPPESLPHDGSTFQTYQDVGLAACRLGGSARGSSLTSSSTERHSARGPGLLGLVRDKTLRGDLYWYPETVEDWRTTTSAARPSPVSTSSSHPEGWQPAILLPGPPRATSRWTGLRNHALQL